MGNRLLRRLQIQNLEFLGEKIPYLLQLQNLLDRLIEYIIPPIYYDLRNYIKNIVFFSKLAWYWRPWDSYFSIQVFALLIRKNGDACGDGFKSAGKKRRSRARAYTIAHNLIRAYNYSCVDDKAYEYFSKKYPARIIKGSPYSTYYRGYELDSRQAKLHDTIIRRVDATEARLKKEAWEQVHKYISYLWD